MDCQSNAISATRKLLSLGGVKLARIGTALITIALLANCTDQSFDAELAAELKVTDCDTTLDGFPVASTDSLTSDLTVQARALVGSLDSNQLTRTVYCLGDLEQYSWTNVPGRRPGGIPVGDLSDQQYGQIWTLMRSLLNERSFKKITLLATDIENSRGSARKDEFTVAFFVGNESDWAFQFDGHHVALNFLVSANRVVLSPAFVGINPSVLNDTEPLQQESNLGRRLFASLSDDQKSVAEMDGLVRGDVRAGSGDGHIDRGRTFQFSRFNGIGLPISQLSDEQLPLIRDLVSVYVDNMRKEYSEPILRSVFAELELGFFVASRSGARQYYRLYIPDVLLIEYNDVSTSHIHTITRLLGEDELSDYGIYARSNFPASEFPKVSLNHTSHSERYSN